MINQNYILIKTLGSNIILLFICINITTSIAIGNTNKFSFPDYNGNILYVGGTGEGNYTKIQDAIDNSSNGDTVFVYNGTYYENVVVDKSINLIGENKNITFIDGSGGTESENVVIIKDANGVNISRFTIQNAGDGRGLSINSKYNTITNNIIGPNHQIFAIVVTNDYNTISYNTIINDQGILIFSSHNIIANNILVVETGIVIEGAGLFNNTITGNTIQGAYTYTIFIEGGDNNKISQNIISNNYCEGIYIRSSKSNIITSNIISLNKDSGIRIYMDCEDNNISGNTISNNYEGILICSNRNNIITKNNLINNTVDATYRYQIFDALFGNNIWDANYWGSSKQEPVPIKGRIGIFIFYFIPWFPQYDYNPAKEPYDIEV